VENGGCGEDFGSVGHALENGAAETHKACVLGAQVHGRKFTGHGLAAPVERGVGGL